MNQQQLVSLVSVIAIKNNIVISNVKSNTDVKVYSVDGKLVKALEINADINFNLHPGIWIVKIKDNDGEKSIKVVSN